MGIILTIYLFLITIIFFYAASIFSSFNYFSVLNPTFAVLQNISLDELKSYQLIAKSNFYEFLAIGLLFGLTLLVTTKLIKSRLKTVLYSLFLLTTLLVTIFFIQGNICSEDGGGLGCIGIIISAPAMTLVSFSLILLPIILIGRSEEKKPKYIVHVLFALAFFIITVPLASFYWAENFLPQQFEKKISSHLQNLEFRVFKPSYIPRGFIKYREKLNLIKSDQKYEIEYINPNTQSRLMITESPPTRYFNKEGQDKIITINGVSARLERASNRTVESLAYIRWEYGGTNLFLVYNTHPSDENIEAEAIKIAESMNNK